MDWKSSTFKSKHKKIARTIHEFIHVHIHSDTCHLSLTLISTCNPIPVQRLFIRAAYALCTTATVHHVNQERFLFLCKSLSLSMPNPLHLYRHIFSPIFFVLLFVWLRCAGAMLPERYIHPLPSIFYFTKCSFKFVVVVVVFPLIFSHFADANANEWCMNQLKTRSGIAHGPPVGAGTIGTINT